MREDHSAVLFVCGTQKVWMGGSDSYQVDMPMYEYCDDDVRVRCTSRSHAISLNLLVRPRLVRSSPFALAGGDLSLLYVTSPDGASVRPGPELYRRLVDALTGPLILRSTSTRIELTGGYVAGIWVAYNPQEIWIEPA